MSRHTFESKCVPLLVAYGLVSHMGRVPASMAYDILYNLSSLCLALHRDTIRPAESMATGCMGRNERTIGVGELVAIIPHR